MTSSNTNIPVAATLQIWLSEVGFQATPATFVGSLGGTISDGTVTASAYLDESNVLFGTGTLIASTGPHSGAFSPTFSELKSPASTYSLTQELLIQMTASGGDYGANFDLSTGTASGVPEPSSSMSLVSGMLLLGSALGLYGTGSG